MINAIRWLAFDDMFKTDNHILFIVPRSNVIIDSMVKND